MENSGEDPAQIPTEANSLVQHKLLKTVWEMLERVEPPLSFKCCIYRVPRRLHKENEEAYTPQVISIGPLHYGEKMLQTMEKHKLRYLGKFLDRAKVSLASFIQAIGHREESIRCSYAESIPLCSDEFIKMVLMDSSFIIELFLRKYFPSLQDEHDHVLFKPWLQDDIEKDLILLENQLPLFVLKDLFELAFASSLNDWPPFLELTYHFFKSYNYQDRPPQVNAQHFTDMIRNFFLPWSRMSPTSASDKLVYIPSATELDSTGVKFKVSSSKCALELEFNNEVLEIPRFEIYDRTESFLRNLMAFEQCQYPYNTYVCDYIFLMDCLINTNKDVDLLVQKKIIINGLGDNAAVATLVNNLCKNITLCEGCFFFTNVAQELNSYYEILWHSWNATFVRDYFGNPWVSASTIAAVVLLVLTFIQAICSVISVYP
ncbi:hypothetical protein K2173_025918 [Erythroxylum novogranatense]|uniref:Uncharacterized protein n=1 Tax=Erythroxylum novogranatense TaxID=1862640 RepID=A0AAV8SIA5_9ROSI|nr:hypothetical protein K2173_025918 [Erythroxylum novogranatense]